MTNLSESEIASLNKLAQTVMKAGVDRLPPFGGLRPVKNPRVAEVYSEDCYICRDPDFARYGLPLCHARPFCGGHVPADDSVCDDCGAWVHGVLPCPDCGGVSRGGVCGDCGKQTEEES